jgi:HlyD family secretion protein
VAAVSNYALDRYQAKRHRQNRTFIAATRATQGEFVVDFDHLGTLEAEKSTPVISEVDGQIVWVVPNGVRVHQGEPIMKLDMPRMEEELRNALSAYYSAEDELQRTIQQREADIKAAEVARDEAQAALDEFRQGLAVDLDAKRAQIAFDTSALESAQSRIERLQRLASKGLITRSEVEGEESDIKSKQFALEKEQKELKLAEAEGASQDLTKKAALDRAAADLKRAQGRRDDDVKNDKQAMEILKRAVERSREALAKAEIVAPTDGIVVLDLEWEGGARRPLNAGDHVWSRRRVARIPDLSVMRVHLALPQERAGDVKVGQKAEVTIDALGGKAFHGHVEEVAATAVEESTSWVPSGERTFRAYVAVNAQNPGELKPGMRANVRIIVDSYRNVVSVPLECVFDREGNRKVVYARRGGQFRAVPVVTGRRSTDRVVIAKGLKGGEAIALRDLGRTVTGAADLREERTTGGPQL